MISHLTQGDLKKLLQVRENAVTVNEKVGYSKPPIKLPNGFSAITADRSLSGFYYDEEAEARKTAERKTAKNYLVLFILIMLVLFYSFNTKA